MNIVLRAGCHGNRQRIRLRKGSSGSSLGALKQLQRDLILQECEGNVIENGVAKNPELKLTYCCHQYHFHKDETIFLQRHTHADVCTLQDATMAPLGVLGFRQNYIPMM